MPPEVNSARIIAGPGPTPLMASAATWTSLAAELHTAAAMWQSITTTMLALWSGPSAIAMAAASASHAAWYTQAAVNAESTAAAATMAAGAYETAVASTVPIAMVLANRVQLAVLVATNILGQNTPAIMATETMYMEMWAQDAAAMGAYQAASAAATATLPQQTVQQPTSGVGNQAAAVAQASATPAGAGQDIISSITGLIDPNGVPWIGLDNGTVLGQYLQAFVSSSNWISWPLDLISTLALGGVDSGISTLGNELAAGLPPPPSPSLVPQLEVKASTGTARTVGGLGISVPPSWATTAQPIKPQIPTIRPIPASQGVGLSAAPIPTAIGAKVRDKNGRRQSVEDAALLKTVKFTARYP